MHNSMNSVRPVIGQNTCGVSVKACVLAAGLAASILSSAALAQGGWNSVGGNGRRNGLTSEIGPDAPTVLWTRPRSSVIAWQPVTLDRRVFTVRQTGFPPETNSNLSPVYAFNLDTGAELWFFNVPFNTGEWTTHVLGARDGKVYVTRSGGGGAVQPPPTGQARIYALDAATGSVVWTSPVGSTTAAGPYEGAVFADNGDLITGDQISIKRFRASDGQLLYTTARVGSVSGSCGVAFALRPGGSPAIYAADAVAGGHVIKAFNAGTGAFLYQSPLMAGFTIQNSPFVGSDGRIFLSRTQNNAGVDQFYAFNDTGAALAGLWNVPAGWTTTSEYASAADGSVFMINPSYQVEKRDPTTGAVLATSTTVVNDYSQRMAVDALGRLFLSNGEFGVSRLISFNPDLTERWNIAIPGNVNIGAPAIGLDGTLIVATTTSVIAYRTPRVSCYANCDGSTVAPILNALDFSCFLSRYTAGDPYANCDGSTVAPVLNALDFSCFLGRYVSGCP